MTRTTTRVVPIVMAAIAAGLVLRVVAGLGAAAQPAAPGALAYRAVVGTPLVFHMAPEDREVTVALHLEARSPARPLRYTAALRVEDEASGRPLWSARAVIDAAAGALGDDGRPLTAPRLLRLPDLELSGPARLVVNLEPGDDAHAGASGAIRVSRRAQRPPSWRNADPRHDSRTRFAGNQASVFGWGYLSDPELALLHDEPTLRRAAAVEPGLSALVTRVTVLAPAAPVVTVEDEGELVGPDAGAAWTVRGPGRVTLRLRGAGSATIRTVDQNGVVAEQPVELAGQLEREFTVVEAGALTVGVLHRAGASFWASAVVKDGSRPLGDAPPPGATGRIQPDRHRLVLWRLTRGGPSLRATLAGDGVARVMARPVDGESTLSWRVVDPAGRVVGSGHAEVAAVAAPFERYPDGAAHEPTPLFAAGPAGSKLELSAVDGPIDISLEAKSGGPEALRLAPAWDLVLGAARVAYAPYLLRRWMPFRPDNHDELTAVPLEAQVRLEPADPGLPPPGPYVATEPLAPRLARVLVEKAEAAPKSPWVHGGFATDETAQLVVGDRLVLDYLLGPSSLGARLAVVVDGAPLAERKIAFPRGRVRIDHLDPGAHSVKVDAPPGFILASAQPSGRTRAFAERRVWRLDKDQSLTIPVSLPDKSPGRTLMFVVYTDADPKTLAGLEARVVIDGMVRQVGVRSAEQATRLDRRVWKPVAGTTAYWLDGEGGPKGTATFGVWLGPDLGPGVHQVKVSLTRGPERAWARFFVTGRADRSPGLRAHVEWEGD